MKKHLEFLREQVNASVESLKLAENREDEQIIEYAYDVMRNQKRLIIALQNELRNNKE